MNFWSLIDLGFSYVNYAEMLQKEWNSRHFRFAGRESKSPYTGSSRFYISNYVYLIIYWRDEYDLQTSGLQA